ncbi:hypothetical protein ElyMa_005995800 [Elysia marginata]|uniref:Uncharacterized protein n=1 Tax=Elysia marginata TaxID=1093978 RepID=A0AAV4GFW1_9GAST|nr:hypothetical protein ElyMa_005995800 [Elysia marginata]
MDITLIMAILVYINLPNSQQPWLQMTMKDVDYSELRVSAICRLQREVACIFLVSNHHDGVLTLTASFQMPWFSYCNLTLGILHVIPSSACTAGGLCSVLT